MTIVREGDRFKKRNAFWVILWMDEDGDVYAYPESAIDSIREDAEQSDISFLEAAEDYTENFALRNIQIIREPKPLTGYTKFMREMHL